MTAIETKMSLEDIIRQIVRDELLNVKSGSKLIPVSQFCKEKNISRVTLWRAEKAGKCKIVRIGKKTFVDENAPQ